VGDPIFTSGFCVASADAEHGATEKMIIIRILAINAGLTIIAFIKNTWQQKSPEPSVFHATVPRTSGIPSLILTPEGRRIAMDSIIE
jgi:hypothetical protein